MHKSNKDKFLDNLEIVSYFSIFIFFVLFNKIHHIVLGLKFFTKLYFKCILIWANYFLGSLSRPWMTHYLTKFSCQHSSFPCLTLFFPFTWLFSWCPKTNIMSFHVSYSLLTFLSFTFFFTLTWMHNIASFQFSNLTTFKTLLLALVILQMF